MEEKERISKKTIIIVCIISLIVLGIIIAAVYIYNNVKPDVINEKKSGAEITLNYAGEKGELSLKDMKPTKDADGIKLSAADKVFNFTVNTELIEARTANYEIYITKDKKGCNVADEALKVYLEKESDGTFNKILEPTAFKGLESKDKFGVEKGAMVLYKDIVSSSRTINYRLKIWVAEAYVPKEGEVLNCTINVAVLGEAK